MTRGNAFSLIADRFRRCDRGATAVEYAMLLGLFAAGIIVWGTRTGKDVNKGMSDVAVAMDNTPGGDNAPVIQQGGD